MKDRGVGRNFNRWNIFRAMKIYGVLGGLREVLKRDFGENEWPRDGEKFQFWGYFQSLLKVVGMSLCDSTFGSNGGAMKIFGVLVCFIEKYWKVILVKNEGPRSGEKFESWEHFQSCLKVVECDYVFVLWVLMVELRRSFDFWGVLERGIENWFWWKMNDRGVGRNFNFENMFKVGWRWWECDCLIGLWLLIVEPWISFEFWVFWKEVF